MICRLGLFLLLFTLATCDRSSPTSPASPPPILQPFQGPWRFNLSKTIAHWQTNGVPATEIAQAQALARAFPLHPDMIIHNDIAVLSGRVEGQYQFFALHPHNQSICGKAWRHEDRYDPGDMDKHLVRLELRESNLYLSLRSHEDAADPADPDVTNMPITAGSAATCGADAAPDPPWSPWRTYIFDRSDQRSD